MTTTQRKYQPAIADIHVECDNGHVAPAARLGRPRWLPVINWVFSYYACSVCGSPRITPVYVQPENDATKLDNLKTLHAQFNAEITRYRDYEWKIVLWSLALTWGVFAISQTRFHGVVPPELEIPATVTVIGAIILGTFLLSTHLLFVHGELTTNRNWREKTRRLLGVYKAGVFPSSWDCYLYQFRHGRDEFIIPFLLHFPRTCGRGRPDRQN
jgi:hypothetical protein